MIRHSPWQSYRNVAANTASPGQLVLMLYEGAIRFLEKALLGFQEQDLVQVNQTINNNVQRAQAIINELNLSLNLRDGGEVSANLRRLYDYLDRRLQEGNLQKKEAPIHEVISRLSVLRDAWAEMLSRQSGPSPSPSPSVSAQA